MFWLFALFFLLLGTIKHKRSDNEIDFNSIFYDSGLRSNTAEYDNVQLSFYERNSDFNAVNVPGGQMKLIKPENLVVMIPGHVSNDTKVQEEYTTSFCESLKTSFLKHENFSLMCYKWKAAENSAIEAVQERGLRLGKLINEKVRPLVKKIHFVAHDLGCVLAQTAASTVERKIDFIFGLDQRNLKNSNLLLNEKSANVVELIHSTSSPASKGHRNFFLLPKTKDNHEFNLYQAFSQAIANNGNVYRGVSCRSATDFTNGECKNSREASLWSTELMRSNTISNEEHGEFYLFRT